RLDAMHDAISRYFGGRLCDAPVAEVRPRKILELGSGSGAWAIQAAKQFPEAQVFAVDKAPLPDRILPLNMHFERADLAEELKFEAETFDVVHSRFAMRYVPNGKDAIARAARLVRPGGLLLMEDGDGSSWTGGPAIRQLSSNFLEYLKIRGADGEMGRNLETIINSLGAFEDVNVQKITFPFSGTGPGEWQSVRQPLSMARLNWVLDAAKNDLGVAMKRSIMQGFVNGGSLSEQTVKQLEEDLGQMDSTGTVYFTWARRQ
ncbi:S-adenosyl-L-methionine-dependent methyltransferase, partial [Mycena latifolia]